MRHEAEILMELKTKFGSNFAIERMDTNKGNGVVRHGFSIKESEKKLGIVIYVDELLHLLEEGMTPKNFANLIYRVYKEHRLDTGSVVEGMTKEKILQKVLPRLVAGVGNLDYLKDLVFRPFLDMAVIYKISIPEIPGSIMNVSGSLASYFSISEEELYEAAIRNGKMFEGYHVQDLDEFIDEAEEKFDSFPDIPDDGLPEFKMYIMTNKERRFGSAALLQKDMLESMETVCKGSYYIIPASVNEILTIPEYLVDDLAFIKAVIYEANRHMIPKENFLSDRIYKFSAETKEVSIA